MLARVSLVTPNRSVHLCDGAHPQMVPPGGLLAHAKAKALEAMRGDGPHPAQERLARFYDIDSDCAGVTFAQLQPVASRDITASDLLAAKLLSVPIGPRATRRISRGRNDQERAAP
jgi:hypothetical protein